MGSQFLAYPHVLVPDRGRHVHKRSNITYKRCRLLRMIVPFVEGDRRSSKQVEGGRQASRDRYPRSHPHPHPLPSPLHRRTCNLEAPPSSTSPCSASGCLLLLPSGASFGLDWRSLTCSPMEAGTGKKCGQRGVRRRREKLGKTGRDKYAMRSLRRTGKALPPVDRVMRPNILPMLRRAAYSSLVFCRCHTRRTPLPDDSGLRPTAFIHTTPFCLPCRV